MIDGIGKESDQVGVMAAAPLAGLRVLEMATYVAGPSCGVALAQLGAEVIRIDPIGGATDFRRLPLDANGDSLYWAGLNTAKQSIEIDTRSDDGREIVYEMLSRSGPDGGILVTNSVGKGWLDYENLTKYRNDLIQIRIEGRGEGKPAVDYTINCEVGLPLITGPSGVDRPVNHVLPAWDLLCGLHAAIGVLAAVRARRLSNQGQFISISLADVAVSTMGQLGFLSDVALNGRGRIRDGNYLYGSFGCDFRSKDGRQVMIVALTERQWQNLVKLTETGEIINSLEGTLGVVLTSEEVRYKFREVLVGLFRPWFENRNFAEISEALDAERVLWGSYRTLEELVNEPGSLLKESQIFDNVTRPGLGTYPSPRGVLRHRTWPGRKAVETSELGSDTDSVLAELLGRTSAEIAKLRNDGVIGGGS
jgi:2-methylfumaryl-CoA isomerase